VRVVSAGVFEANCVQGLWL